MNYSPFLVGFELEIDNISIYNVELNEIGKRDDSPKPYDKYWNIQLDASVPGGIEVQSPVNPPTNEIAQRIKALKVLGGRITKTCGFHIHISHPTEIIGISLPKISSWNSRRKWVESPRDRKYQPVRRVAPNHLEVRCFNGSLNVRYILCSISLVLHSVRTGTDIIEHDIRFV